MISYFSVLLKLSIPTAQAINYPINSVSGAWTAHNTQCCSSLKSNLRAVSYTRDPTLSKCDFYIVLIQWPWQPLDPINILTEWVSWVLGSTTNILVIWWSEGPRDHYWLSLTPIHGYYAWENQTSNQHPKLKACSFKGTAVQHCRYSARTVLLFLRVQHHRFDYSKD